MYKVVLPKEAQKSLDRLDNRYLCSIINCLEDLKRNPLIGKKLHDNLRDKRSIREGVYWIIYEVIKKTLDKCNYDYTLSGCVQTKALVCTLYFSYISRYNGNT